MQSVKICGTEEIESGKDLGGCGYPKYSEREKDGKRVSEMIHHSLALDSGGSTDFGSVLVRPLSNESSSPTDLSEGSVRLSGSSGYLEVIEDDGW